VNEPSVPAVPASGGGSVFFVILNPRIGWASRRERRSGL